MISATWWLIICGGDFPMLDHTDPGRGQEAAAHDWLGIPGLRRDMPIDDLIEAIVLDVLRPLRYVDPQIDPVKYEVAVHQITASVREGAWALVRTSSSPLVTECGEYVFAIYDSEGHSAYVNTGVMPHLTGTESAIKFIRHCYSMDRDGIHPGDQFIVNEPYLMGIHTPDILIARPVFAGEEIVAWIASLTHTIEMGAKDPGGTADSTDVFQEGLRIPCLKLIRAGQADPHVYRLIERATRNPAQISLDIASKVAGNNVAAVRIEEMIAQEGAAFVRGVLAKMINETETKARARIAAIPDGTWQNVSYADHNGLHPAFLKAAVQAEKRGDVITFDFTGTSPQTPGPVNAALPGTIGAIFSVLVLTIFSDLHPNRGIVSACRISVPKGCMYNPRYPAALFAAPPGPLCLLASVVTKIVSEMAMAGGLNESIVAPWNGNVNSVYMGGIDQYGQLQGSLTLDTNGGGTGGTPFDDGDDTAAFMLAPGSIMADIEMHEANHPVVYLFRRQRTDSCGHGQMRGGVGGEIAVTVHNSSRWRVGFRGIGTEVATTRGLAGGYPADSARTGFIFGVDPLKLSPAEYAKLLRPVDELMDMDAAVPEKALIPPRLLAPGDIYCTAWCGGGGYGDALKRDPERVAKDVRAGLVSEERCQDTYGVVLTENKAVDAAATTALRAAMRKTRLAEAEPARIAMSPQQPAVQLDMPSQGPLRRGNAGTKQVIVCADCGRTLCPDHADFHNFVPNLLRVPASLGHRTVRPDWQAYREYFCPGCGTLLDVTFEEAGAEKEAAE
jgi:N-methylhydantoinase B